MARRTLSKSRIKTEGKQPWTCWGGFVYLCGLAGRPRPHGVHAVHAEAIVDVTIEFEESRVVVPGYPEQLLPVAWQLAFFIFNNELYGKKTIRELLARWHVCGQNVPQILLLVCRLLRETIQNSCLDESIMGL